VLPSRQGMKENPPGVRPGGWRLCRHCGTCTDSRSTPMEPGYSACGLDRLSPKRLDLVEKRLRHIGRVVAFWHLVLNPRTRYARKHQKPGCCSGEGCRFLLTVR
jgi:hypothetical protein